MARDYKAEYAARKANGSLKGPTEPTPELTPDQKYIKELLRANASLQGKVKQAKAKVEDLVTATFEAARDACLTMGNPPPVPVPEKDRRKGKPEVALLHTTDWQLGKKSKSYGTEVAVERMNLLAEKVGKLTDIQRAAHPVRRMALLLGGDLIENVDIFKGQVYEVDAYLFEQVFGAVQITEDLIRRMLAKFDHVDIYEEYGNHGRIGGSRGALPASDNWDRIIYKIVRDKMEAAGETRLTWHPHDDWYNVVNIGTYKAVLIHGDEIFSFGGTPLFATLKKGMAWSSGVIQEPFVDIYSGHYHTPHTLIMPNGNRIFMTGSIESGNEYAARQIGALGRPTQRLHFINPEKARVTAEYTVWLDEDLGVRRVGSQAARFEA